VSDESIAVARYVASALPTDSFDSPVWNAAEPVSIRHLWSGEPAAPERHAEARLCWSNRGLHVRFIGNQREPLVTSPQPNASNKTLGLWDRDVCEIFIAPDPKNPSIYYEFEAAPTGEWVDLAIVITPSGRETEWDYQSGMEAAAAVGNQQITIGMTIPWSERIPSPVAGDLWKVNLFRCVGPEEPARYLAWRPTRAPEPAFHVPDAFGSLRFE
jgi:Carbohydrate family 9 binding domain-like